MIGETMSTLGKTLLVAVLMISANVAYAEKICKASMMGRVCYEEGQEPATSEHMKGNAVADAAAKKKVDVADASKK
jgi:hypothetical protein